jgi:hypothetical protein
MPARCEVSTTSFAEPAAKTPKITSSVGTVIATSMRTADPSAVIAAAATTNLDVVWSIESAVLSGGYHSARKQGNVCVGTSIDSTLEV